MSMRLIGAALYWLAWPLYQVYLRFGDRTRVVLVHDGDVLAMQQWVSPGGWSLPGGGMRRGELPVDGAVRELYEETGIRLAPSQLEYLGECDYRRHGHRFTYHVYAAAVDTALPLRRQWYEVSAVAWLPADKLHDRNASDDTLDSLALVRARTRLLQ